MAPVVQKTFFSRYKKIISLVYGAITLSAIFLFSFLYNDNYDAIIKSLNLRIVEQKDAFNGLLRVRYDAVKALQRQARNFLNRSYEPLDTPIRLVDVPKKKIYTLVLHPKDKASYGTLVGEGSVAKILPETWQEIQMAFSLNPLMAVLKKSISTMTSLHYTSKSRFALEFPYRDGSAETFDPTLYSMEYYQRSLPAVNREDKVFWTDVYPHPSGRGLMITCAAPVYKGVHYKGVAGIDFLLESIDHFIANIHHDFGELIVMNEHETVVANATLRKQGCCEIVKLNRLLPEDLDPAFLETIRDSALTQFGKYWIFVGETSYAPWKVIYFCRSIDIALQTLRNIMPSLLLTIVFTTLFLIGADRLISREFIEPASQLVEHIANQGIVKRHRNVSVREPWKTWFNAISEVFDENRALVGKLQHHIEELDELVAQRTKDLSRKNKLLEKTLEDLKKAQSQIVTQEKLAGLGSLTAGIAHEIRNPLNFIINFSESSRQFVQEVLQAIQNLKLKKESAQYKEIQSLCEHIEQNMKKIEEHGNRADMIVRSMLSHARGGHDVLREANLNDLLKENLSLALAGMKQFNFVPQIQWDLDPTLPSLSVYAQDLGRVLLNIIHNACYALQKKRVADPSFLPEIFLHSYTTEESVVVEVRDNGPGIHKSVRKKIFDPFFTTKPTGEGTGLGLSLSYDIVVNQHHGKLLVDSEVGQYTQFTIELPLARPKEI